MWTTSRSEGGTSSPLTTVPAAHVPSSEAELPVLAPRTLLHQGFDGVVPVAAYLAADHVAGTVRGALVAVAVAVVIGVARRARGEQTRIVVASTGAIVVFAASATATGQARDFFLPDLVLNVAATLVLIASLLLRRPITAVACSAARLEHPRCWTDPSRMRAHVRLTLAWLLVALVHVGLLVAFYRAGSVMALGAVSALVNKPSLVLLVALTVVVARRGRRRKELTTR